MFLNIKGTCLNKLIRIRRIEKQEFIHKKLEKEKLNQEVFKDG